MNGVLIFVLAFLGIMVSVSVGLYIRNWSRRHQFMVEFGVSPNSEYSILKQAIFLRLKDRKNSMTSIEKDLSTLRQGIDQLMSPSDLDKRQLEIDKLSRSYGYVSAHFYRLRRLIRLCLPTSDDPKSLLESVDWSLEHPNPLASL